MLFLIKIIFYLTIVFIGYALGRIGHILGGQLKAPHHWVYGGIFIIVGIILGITFGDIIYHFSA